MWPWAHDGMSVCFSGNELTGGVLGRRRAWFVAWANQNEAWRSPATRQWSGKPSSPERWDANPTTPAGNNAYMCLSFVPRAPVTIWFTRWRFGRLSARTLLVGAGDSCCHFPNYSTRMSMTGLVREIASNEQYQLHSYFILLIPSYYSFKNK